MTLQALEAQAQRCALTIRGVLLPASDDPVPPGTGSLVLLGPDEPRFWPEFSKSPEYNDGAPDPLDRWSKRLIGLLASDWAGTPLYPSDGPPFPPFIDWALRSGQVWTAPVGLLVHDTAGLFISYRGAIALPERLTSPAPSQNPCDTCPDQPCLAACPVGALADGRPYDVPACQDHVVQSPDCQQGCLVRRACPVSQRFGRMFVQSAFHMTAFLGRNECG